MSVLLEFGERGSCRIEFVVGADTQYGVRDILKMIFHDEEFIVQNVYLENSEIKNIDKVVQTMKEFIAFYEGDLDHPKA